MLIQKNLWSATKFRALAEASKILSFSPALWLEHSFASNVAWENVRGYANAAPVEETSTPAVYVTSALGRRATSPILLGLMNHFRLSHPHVGFFMPIGTDPVPRASPGPPLPKHVALIKEQCSILDRPSHMVGVHEMEAEELLAAGKEDELVEKIWNAYQEYRKGKDLIVIDGSPMEVLGGDLFLHGRIAAELGTPVLFTVDFRRDEIVSPDEAINRALIARQELQGVGVHDDQILGVVLNKVPMSNHGILSNEVPSRLKDEGLSCLGVIPWDPVIGSARLNEVATALEAYQIAGSGLDSSIHGIVIAGQTTSGILEELDRICHTAAFSRSMSNEDVPINMLHKQAGKIRSQPVLGGRCALVLATSDRADVALSLAAAHMSGTGPTIAGLLLCDSSNSRLSPAAERILRRFEPDRLFPILTVDMDLYKATSIISQINPGILPDSSAKARHAAEMLSNFVDKKSIEAQIALPRPDRMTPHAFLHSIHKICRSNIQHIVLPEGTDRRILAAAEDVTQRGLAKVTLLGKPDAVYAAARQFKIDLSGCSILDHQTSPRREAYADALAEARASKGLTREQALDHLDDINMFSTMMVRQGDADGMVSGSTCTTAATIRPALQVLRRPGGIVSSLFFMLLPDKVFVYADCAVITEPTAEELANIAITSADTANAFGIEQRVALLSYSTLGSGAGPAVDKVTKATELAKSLRPDLAKKIVGPIQFDAAVDPSVAQQKIKGKEAAEVAGKATVLIFPDLNSGNLAYKAVQRSTGALAVGPLLQGLTKPVNDLSRGCTVGDVINTIACTAVQAIASNEQIEDAAATG